MTLFLIKPISLKHPNLSSTKLIKRLMLLCSLTVLAVGCAVTPKANYITALESPTESTPKVMLMPMDVELSLLTAGGLTEPNAEWTANAREHIQQAIINHSDTAGFQLINYDSNVLTERSDTLDQLTKLHEAVGMTMLTQRVQALPTKANDFRWSLGQNAIVMSETHHADYALFLFVRDSYASAGRQAMIVASTILAAFVPVPVATGGTQIAYASLVDLNTGEIVWFNDLVSGSGDLREADKANVTMSRLIGALPAATNKASIATVE